MNDKDIRKFYSSACLDQTKKQRLKNSLKKKYPEYVLHDNIIDNIDDEYVEKRENDILVTRTPQIAGLKRGMIVSVCAALAVVAGGWYIISIQNNSNSFSAGSSVDTNGIAASDMAATVADLLGTVCEDLNSSSDPLTYAALSDTFTYDGEETFTKLRYAEVVKFYETNSFDDTSVVTEKAEFYSGGVNAKGITALIFAHLSQSDSKAFELLQKSKFTVSLSSLSVEVTLPDGSYAQRKSSSNAVICGDDLAENVSATAEQVLSVLKSKDLKVDTHEILFIHGNDSDTLRDVAATINEYGNYDKYRDEIIARFSHDGIITRAGLKYLFMTQLVEDGSNTFADSCNFQIAYKDGDNGLYCAGVLAEYDPGTGTDNIVRSTLVNENFSTPTLTSMTAEVIPANFVADGDSMWTKFPYAENLYQLTDTKTLVCVRNQGISAQQIDDYDLTFGFSYCIYDSETNSITRTIGANSMYYAGTMCSLNENSFSLYSLDSSNQPNELLTYDFDMNIVSDFSLDSVVKHGEGENLLFDSYNINVSSDSKKVYCTFYNINNDGNYGRYQIYEVNENGSYKAVVDENFDTGTGSYIADIRATPDGRYLIGEKSDFSTDENDNYNEKCYPVYIDLQADTPKFEKIDFDIEIVSGKTSTKTFFYNDAFEYLCLDFEQYINPETRDNAITDVSEEMISVLPEDTEKWDIEIFPVDEKILCAHISANSAETKSTDTLYVFKLVDGKYQLAKELNYNSSYVYDSLNFFYSSSNNTLSYRLHSNLSDTDDYFSEKLNI